MSTNKTQNSLTENLRSLSKPQTVVSSTLFAAYGALNLLDKRYTTDIDYAGKDPFDYAFRQIYIWYTIIVDILFAIVATFLVTLVIRILSVSLVKTSLPLKKIDTSDDRGAAGIIQDEHVDTTDRLIQSCRDQLQWIMGFLLRPVFIQVYFLWIPLIIWIMSLFYAYSFIWKPTFLTITSSKQKLLKKNAAYSSPSSFDKHHRPIAWTILTISFVFAFVWTLLVSS